MTMFTSTALAVEVEPARLELVVSPDEPTQGRMEVRNPSSQAVGVRIQAGPYRFLQSDPRLPSAADWLAFDPADVVLAPHASTTVRATVTPPPNAAQDTAAEYVAAILVDELPAEEATADRTVRPEPVEGRTVMVRQAHHDRLGPSATGPVEGKISIVPRLALPVYLQIQGRQKRQVDLLEVSAAAAGGSRTRRLGAPAAESQDGPKLLRIDAVLQNRGTVHVRPTGTVAVFNQATEQLLRGAPLGKSTPLFPTASRTLPVVMPLPDPGRYRIVVTVEPFEGEILQKEASFEVTADGEVLQE